MAANSKKPKAAPPKTRSLEDMTPSERIGHGILAAFGDLAPSVDKIMQAPLSEAQRLRAITSFEAALRTVGDPHRDPRYAIAHCGDA
jgi:hypothetical protein